MCLFRVCTCKDHTWIVLSNEELNRKPPTRIRENLSFESNIYSDRIKPLRHQSAPATSYFIHFRFFFFFGEHKIFAHCKSQIVHFNINDCMGWKKNMLIMLKNQSQSLHLQPLKFQSSEYTIKKGGNPQLASLRFIMFQ